jgi:uncharacterized protein YejL (UPF0352 family)
LLGLYGVEVSPDLISMLDRHHHANGRTLLLLGVVTGNLDRPSLPSALRQSLKGEQRLNQWAVTVVLL